MNVLVFERHRQPKHESWHCCIVWYLTFGNAAVIRFDNTAAIRFGNNATAHSERCTGKTHTLYLATWRSAVVRLGNVAYCLAFSVQSKTHTDLMYTYVWHRLLQYANQTTNMLIAFSQRCMSAGICRLLPLYTIIYAHRRLKLKHTFILLQIYFWVPT